MNFPWPAWALDLSDQNLDDQKLLVILNSDQLRGIRWLDLRFNLISREGLEFLCQKAPESIEVIALFGNPCGCPSELYQTDLATGETISKSIRPNSLTVELEQKYGYRKWFHPITEFGDPFPLPPVLDKFDLFSADQGEEFKLEPWDGEFDF